MSSLTLRIVTILLALGLQTQVFAYNPHHRLTIALENGVRALPGGSTLVDRAREQGLEYLLFHCFVVNDSNAQICQQDYVIDQDAQTIFFHANYHGADFEDLVLLLEQALVNYLD